MNIIDHGSVQIPQHVVSHADTIKYENYKTNTPAKFQKHGAVSSELEQSIAAIAGVDVNRVDWVYFSVCQGAEPHTDQLGDKFTDTTYVIPVILPTGKSTITANGQTEEVQLGHIYEFNHNETHSMELEDTTSGCVVIMAAIKTI